MCALLHVDRQPKKAALSAARAASTANTLAFRRSAQRSDSPACLGVALGERPDSTTAEEEEEKRSSQHSAHLEQEVIALSEEEFSNILSLEEANS